MDRHGMSLKDKADQFIKAGSPNELSELLLRCVKENTIDALEAVQKIAEDMYGGMTYNFELKAPAAWCLPFWRVDCSTR